MRTPTLQRLRAMSHVLEVVEWAYYGYLIVPAEMTKPGGIELLKSIFNFGFVNDLNHADVRASPQLARRLCAMPSWVLRPGSAPIPSVLCVGH